VSACRRRGGRAYNITRTIARAKPMIGRGSVRAGASPACLAYHVTPLEIKHPRRLPDMGDDVVEQVNAESPGSGGASPYLTMGRTA
jgi:hypothetical protein